MLRRFTSSPTLKAAAEESGAAAKEAGKDKPIPEAAASTSGEQTPAATVAMRKGRMSGPVSWGSLALLLITGAGLLAFYDREKRRKLETVKQGPSVGKAAIGGAFELVNQDGKKVTDKDFKGNWNLVYFGFTFCPDICPDELKKMAEAIDKVETNIGVKVVPIFISVDPERDNVEQVGRYVKEFHPRLVGLTGSAEAVKQAAKAYRVYYMKTEEEGDDYLVDHSIIQYLMDPNMEFVKFFGKNYTVDTLAESIAGEIKAAAG
ncbi:hypothetical protein KFL_001200230 [Klebsormidium nitens]|uniref:Thioredoxin domain-containing protein n=1 Tax=Klebsormidium nitens TaxID=105231 RepID=A0A1Y1HZU1_KLENI|nr:hypothetical protein KFL_001200230 [Klebsormidium nitens]|eukprot:GAQ82699.1 hypothetical protein KFL_001200230 [Klebsormidium nitens]